MEAKLCAVEEDTFEVYLYATIKNEKVSERHGGVGGVLRLILRLSTENIFEFQEFSGGIYRV